MYLSSNSKSILYLLGISFFVFLLQINLPTIPIYYEINLNLDLVLVLLTILVYQHKTYQIILLAFFYGLIQDFMISVEQIGLLAFLKSFLIFQLGFLKKYYFIWRIELKLLVILFIIFFHFIIYYLIIYSHSYLFILSISVLQSVISFSLIFLFNKFLFNSKLI